MKAPPDLPSCEHCGARIERTPVPKGGRLFCSHACAARRPVETLALAFDNPKGEVGSFAGASAGVRPMSERIKEMYTPPANVTIAEPEAAEVDAALRVRLRSTLRELAELDRAQAAALHSVAVDLLAARDAGDWSKVTAQAIALSRIANGLEALAAASEGKAS